MGVEESITPFADMSPISSPPFTDHLLTLINKKTYKHVAKAVDNGTYIAASRLTC
jgi:hypothetical protein